MKHFLLLSVLLLSLATTYAQKRKPLQGKAMIGTVVAEDGEIKIRNMQTGVKTASLPGGFFTIDVKKGDTLMFSGVEIHTRKMVITAFDLDEDLLLMELDPIGTQLQQVNVDANAITTESLGLGNQKKYTPAERKLETATTVKPQRDPDKAYTAVGTDGALNAVSGRTKMLKKQLQVERKEKWKQNLTERYDRKYFTDTLKVPADRIDDFLFYSVEDKSFLKTLESEDEEKVQLQLSELATRYKKTLQLEKKK